MSIKKFFTSDSWNEFIAGITSLKFKVDEKMSDLVIGATEPETTQCMWFCVEESGGSRRAIFENLTLVSEYYDGQYRIENTGYNSYFTTGKTYELVIDGVSHTAVAKDFEYTAGYIIPFIGNLSFYNSSYEDTGETFAAAIFTDGMFRIKDSTIDPNTVHTVSLYEVN